jgi:hypothetical protein
MSINSWFRDPVYVQDVAEAWDGAKTYTERAGNNMGYARVLSQRERASVDKPALFSTHRIVMTCVLIPEYGDRLRIGTAHYDVKGVDPHGLSGGGFQTVDCEVVT